MKYFFVLGTNTALSVAELAAAVDLKKPRLLAADFLVVEIDREIEAVNLMKRLGGMIKIGRVAAEIADQGEISGENKGQKTKLMVVIEEVALAKQRNSAAGKFNFGLSSYGSGNFNKQDLGLKLKKYFSEAGVNSRFVVSREKTLSSVVVTQNKLISRGIEIVLATENDSVHGAKADSKILIGETLTVQPFKDLSRRDFGRPARDDLSGMLPPKLAQIMINLAQVAEENAVIIDPFCGSGTILSEAALMGYKNLFGSDIAFKAVEDTRKNMSWIKELYGLNDCKIKLMVKNAADLSKFIKAGSADAIITEPFLGPQRGMINFKQIAANLEELYTLALSEFKKVLKPGGRVVMIWPLFYGQRPIAPRYEGFKILNMIPEELRGSEFIRKTDRDTIVYGRPGQKVYREVVVMEKI